MAAFSQGTPLPYTKIQFFSNSGQPLAGGSLCSFLSGTATPLATFTDYTLTTANPQCVVLDSSGRASIWLDTTKIYRAILRDSVGVTIWTQDGIPGSGGGSTSGGGGGGSSLWTQNGSTIYNSVLGSKVCVAATACGTALAQLDVAGATSGSTHLIRIDDTAGTPGIDLYGNGGSYQGSYLAAGITTGLKLQASDGFGKLTVTPSAVTVFNGAATGGTSLILKQSATQGAVNPLVMQSSVGTNLSWIDANGVFNSAHADGGINVTGAASHVDSIQTVGGVTATWLYARDSLFLACEPVPALSASGQARLYCDSTTTPKAIYASIDGGAYAPLGSGGGGSSLFSGIGTGTNTSATMTVGTGGTLTFSGSGVLNANQVNATTVPVNAAADQTIVTTAAATGAWKSVPDCDDSGGNHLNYDTTTHAFSCGTTGGTVGSVSFSAITGSTNTTAAMRVGTGSSLDYTGSGTIAANLFNNGVAPASGSIWKSNGSLQPIATASADIVGLFSGGDGCSGTNALVADGTCRSVTGAGVYLPLAGGTMTGDILFTGNKSVGSASFPAQHGFFSGNVEGINLRTIQGSPSGILDFFDWRISQTHVFDLRNSTAGLVARFDDLQHQFSFNGSLFPLTSGSTFDLGFDTLTRWRKLWVQDIDSSGSITAAGVSVSGNLLVNGTALIATAVATNQFVASATSTFNGLATFQKGSAAINVGESARNLVVQSTDAVGADIGPQIGFSGSTGGATSPYAFGTIAGRKEGATAYAGYLQFATTTGSSGVIQERMRITSTGAVGIGTQFPSSALDVSGAITSSGGLVLNGGTINGGGIGGAFNFNGSTSTNGNIVFNAGNVPSFSSVQVNGRLGAGVATLPFIINEVGATAGAGIAIKHGGSFDAAWQAGIGSAFDVIGNDASTHRFIVYHSGHIQSGSSLISSCVASVGTCTLTTGSSDVRGSFTVNAAPSTVTVTFGSSFTSAPFCVASSWAGVSGTVSTTTTAITIATNSGGALTTYHCIQ